MALLLVYGRLFKETNNHSMYSRIDFFKSRRTKYIMRQHKYYQKNRIHEYCHSSRYLKSRLQYKLIDSIFSNSDGKTPVFDNF